MPNSSLTIIDDNQIDAIIEIAVSSLPSELSRKMYRVALRRFFVWHRENGSPPISKFIVLKHRDYLQDIGYSSSTINLSMTAIRNMVTEAVDNGFLEPHIANGIAKIKGVPSRGVRAGNWMTNDEINKLINMPDISTLKGIRDRAILSLLFGCNLRRSELTHLTLSHIQMREGRWVIIDMLTKAHHIRSVTIPKWTKICLDAWIGALAEQGIDVKVDEPIFRAVNKGDNLAGERIANRDAITGGKIFSDGYLSERAIKNIVSEYGTLLGYESLAPHDLRRTYAKLADRVDPRIRQIQKNMGHNSVEYTLKYIGNDQDFVDSPGDRINIELNE